MNITKNNKSRRQTSQKLDLFNLASDGIDINSNGSGIAEVNEVANASDTSQNFKASTSGSRLNSSPVAISSSGKIARVKFNYSISGGDASYDIRLRPQLQKISDSSWVDIAISNVVKTYPATAGTFFDTNSGSTLTDSGTGSYSEFRLQETTATISGNVVFYLDASEIDTSHYYNFRVTVFHNGGAEVIGSFTANIYLNMYRNTLGVNPNTISFRMADTIYAQLSPSSGSFQVYQDTSLLS